MTDLTPNDIALRLVQLSRLLDTAQGELEQADENAVRARLRYEVTEARAFLQAEASNADTKKRMALLESADEKLDAEIADKQVRSLRARIKVLDVQVDIGRSLFAAKRAEWGAS